MKLSFHSHVKIQLLCRSCSNWNRRLGRCSHFFFIYFEPLKPFEQLKFVYTSVKDHPNVHISCLTRGEYHGRLVYLLKSMYITKLLHLSIITHVHIYNNTRQKCFVIVVMYFHTHLRTIYY